MSDYFGNILNRSSVYQLIGDEGVSKIVDGGVFYANLPKAAGDNLADVSD